METESDIRFEILSLIEDKDLKKQINDLLKKHKKVVEQEVLTPIMKQIKYALM